MTCLNRVNVPQRRSGHRGGSTRDFTQVKEQHQRLHSSKGNTQEEVLGVLKYLESDAWCKGVLQGRRRGLMQPAGSDWISGSTPPTSCYWLHLKKNVIFLLSPLIPSGPPPPPPPFYFSPSVKWDMLSCRNTSLLSRGSDAHVVKTRSCRMSLEVFFTGSQS